MAWLRAALSCMPVVGPALDGVDAALQGDRAGATLELCGAAMDLCCLGPGLVVSAVARRQARGLVKRKLKQKAWQAAIKLGVTAASALLEFHQAGAAQPPALGRSGRADADGHPSLRRRLRVVARRLEQAERFGRRASGAVGPSGRVGTFAELASADARLHAALASAVYLPSGERRGALRGDEAGVFYAYVGGNGHRGFWYAPASRHLVLAERGTSPSDADDLRRDAFLIVGMGRAAISGRAQTSLEALNEQLTCHDCDRVTVCGHSLGGAVAVYLASLPAASRQGVVVDAVHAFNAGGLPDLARSCACSLNSSEVHAHRIRGDVVSAGFLPMAQHTYQPKAGLLETAHRVAHFL